MTKEFWAKYSDNSKRKSFVPGYKKIRLLKVCPRASELTRFWGNFLNASFQILDANLTQGLLQYLMCYRL